MMTEIKYLLKIKLSTYDKNCSGFGSASKNTLTHVNHYIRLKLCYSFQPDLSNFS